jgi:hypothetical protein
VPQSRVSAVISISILSSSRAYSHQANAEACDGACTVDAEEVARQKAEAWWAALDPEQVRVSGACTSACAYASG